HKTLITIPTRRSSDLKVHKNFIKDVIKREKMSSTAFNNIVAVPHSLHMDASSSCISIYIPEHPIKWGNSDNIRLIALIAMDKNRSEEHTSELQLRFDL